MIERRSLQCELFIFHETRCSRGIGEMPHREEIRGKLLLERGSPLTSKRTENK